MVINWLHIKLANRIPFNVSFPSKAGGHAPRAMRICCFFFCFAVSLGVLFG